MGKNGEKWGNGRDRKSGIVVWKKEAVHRGAEWRQKGMGKEKEGGVLQGDEDRERGGQRGGR